MQMKIHQQKIIIKRRLLESDTPIQPLTFPKMISSIIKPSKLDLNSKQSQDPTVKYCPLFIPKNANIVEDVFKFSDMKRALDEMELTVDDQPLAKISKKTIEDQPMAETSNKTVEDQPLAKISKSEKGTTEAASKICFTASMDSIIKSLIIHDIVEDVIFFKKILQKFSIGQPFIEGVDSNPTLNHIELDWSNFELNLIHKWAEIWNYRTLNLPNQDSATKIEL